MKRAQPLRALQLLVVDATPTNMKGVESCCRGTRHQLQCAPCPSRHPVVPIPPAPSTRAAATSPPLHRRNARAATTETRFSSETKNRRCQAEGAGLSRHSRHWSRRATASSLPATAHHRRRRSLLSISSRQHTTSLMPKTALKRRPSRQPPQPPRPPQPPQSPQSFSSLQLTLTSLTPKMPLNRP